jgi:tripartite-type tricarboxylate transporter receptor subunit TctC
MDASTTGATAARRAFLRSTWAAWMSLAGAGLMAQTFPRRPVELVNPYPPSGQVDVVARALVGPLQRALGQPVSVKYIVGAGGANGIAAVAKAEADGHTLVLAAPAIATLPEVEKLFSREPPFRVDDFAGVALITVAPTVLVVNPSLPVKNAQEFIEFARQRPGQMMISAGGLYGGTHLPMAMLERATGTTFRKLLAAGGGPALSAVLTGHAAANAAALSIAQEHIKAGRLRVLAHWGDQPIPELPDVPSFRQIGVNVEFNSWSAVFVPVKTPPAVVQVLRNALRQATQDPQFEAAMRAAGQRIDYRDGTAFNEWFRHERKELDDTLRAIGKVTS